jgi:hypothetical protein
MKNLLKYFIAGMFVINSCSGLKAQSNPVTRSPVYPEEFWKSKEGFEYVKGDTIYKIKDFKEILTIEDSLEKVEITDTNHYGNVEDVLILNKTDSSFKTFTKGVVSPEGGAYLHYFPPTNISEEEILENFLEYDKMFRDFKKENNIDGKLEEY